MPAQLSIRPRISCVLLQPSEKMYMPVWCDTNIEPFQLCCAVTESRVWSNPWTDTTSLFSLSLHTDFLEMILGTHQKYATSMHVRVLKWGLKLGWKIKPRRLLGSDQEKKYSLLGCPFKSKWVFYRSLVTRVQLPPLYCSRIASVLCCNPKAAENSPICNLTKPLL